MGRWQTAMDVALALPRPARARAGPLQSSSALGVARALGHAAMELTRCSLLGSAVCEVARTLQLARLNWGVRWHVMGRRASRAACLGRNTCLAGKYLTTTRKRAASSRHSARATWLAVAYAKGCATHAPASCAKGRGSIARLG
jgi:hypothetical protein